MNMSRTYQSCTTPPRIVRRRIWAPAVTAGEVAADGGYIARVEAVVSVSAARPPPHSRERGS